MNACNEAYSTVSKTANIPRKTMTAIHHPRSAILWIDACIDASFTDAKTALILRKTMTLFARCLYWCFLNWCYNCSYS